MKVTLGPATPIARKVAQADQRATLATVRSMLEAVEAPPDSMVYTQNGFEVWVDYPAVCWTCDDPGIFLLHFADGRHRVDDPVPACGKHLRRGLRSFAKRQALADRSSDAASCPPSVDSQGKGYVRVVVSAPYTWEAEDC